MDPTRDTPPKKSTMPYVTLILQRAAGRRNLARRDRTARKASGRKNRPHEKSRLQGAESGGPFVCKHQPV